MPLCDVSVICVFSSSLTAPLPVCPRSSPSAKKYRFPASGPSSTVANRLDFCCRFSFITLYSTKRSILFLLRISSFKHYPKYIMPLSDMQKKKQSILFFQKNCALLFIIFYKTLTIPTTAMIQSATVSTSIAGLAFFSMSSWGYGS